MRGGSGSRRSGFPLSPLPPLTSHRLPLTFPDVIRFSHVSKTYPNGVPALRDVSFQVSKGEFAFLTGHSGAGKSSVLSLIFAEQRPNAGEVKVSGFPVSELSPGQIPRLRRKLGIVFQDFRLLPYRTVEENVAFALEVTGAGSRRFPAGSCGC